MKPLKSPYNIAGKSSMIVGALIVIANILKRGPFFSNPFACLGLGFLMVGLCMLSYIICFEKKLKRFMEDGVCFDADILDMHIGTPGIKIGGHICFYVTCSYQNGEITCYATSRWLCMRKNAASFLVSSRGNRISNDLIATVYVNRNNPSDYVVRVCIVKP